MTSRLLLVSALLSLAIAGCVTPQEDAVDAATSQGDPEGALVSSEPESVAFDGSLGVGAVVCPVVTCVGESPVPDARWMETAAKGIVNISLTMEWAAATPNTERMLYGIFVCAPDACNSDEDMTLIDFVYGTSPLAYEATQIEVPAGETLYVFANIGSTFSGGGVYAVAHTPQDFHIEGNIIPVPAPVA